MSKFGPKKPRKRKPEESVEELEDDIPLDSSADEVEQEPELEALDEQLEEVDLEEDEDDEVEEIELDLPKETVIPGNQIMGTMRLETQEEEGGVSARLKKEERALARSLLFSGALSKEEVEQAVQESNKANTPIGKALLNTGFAKESKLLQALLSNHYKLPNINLINTKIPGWVLKLIPGDVARECRAIPLEKVGHILCVVMDDVFNHQAMERLRYATKSKLFFLRCSKEAMDEALKKYYPPTAASASVGPPASAAPSPSTGMGGPPAPASPFGPPQPPRVPPQPLRALRPLALSASVGPSQPVQGRAKCFAFHWYHIHYYGRAVVPEEARL